MFGLAGTPTFSVAITGLQTFSNGAFEAIALLLSGWGELLVPEVYVNRVLRLSWIYATRPSLPATLFEDTLSLFRTLHTMNHPNHRTGGF